MILHNQGSSSIELPDVGSTVKAGGTYNFGNRLLAFSDSQDVETALTDETLKLQKTLSPLTFYTAERAVKKLHRALIKDEDGVIKSLDNLSSPALDDLMIVEHKSDGHKQKKTQLKNIPRVWGSEYKYAESNTVSTTTLLTFTQKLRLSTVTIPAGDYRIGYQWEWRADDGVQGFIQCQLDDGTPLLADTEPDVGTPSQNDWMLVGGFMRVTLTNDVHTIDIDFRKEIAGGSALKIRKARLEIWRIS
jgi:hypothetical protein